MNRQATRELCENCRYWVACDTMIDWGVCAKNDSAKQIKDKKVTGILRRYNENCCDFKPGDAA